MQTERHSDVSINLSTFFLKNIGLWIPEDSVEERRMKMMLFFTVFTTMTAAVIIFRDLYFTLLYEGDVLYVLTNVLTVVMGLVKMYTILMHKTEFINLIVYMQQNFWIVNYDFREEEILNNCRKTCTFFISSVTSIGVCAMLSYIITPIIANVGKNQTEWILPINLWISLSLYISPYYEILFLYEVVILYIVASTYFCFDNIFCILVVHLAGQFRVLRHRFTKLCNLEHKICENVTSTEHVSEFYEKLKLYIRHHQKLINYYKRLETVYTMITFCQVLVFSVLICLFAYQGLLAAAPIARRAIFIFLLIGSMALLFMFTYSCDGIIEHSDNVALGAYSALWTITPMNKFGRMLRNDLILVIERSRRVCCLTGNGFFPVSLETYTTILSTAMSYFALLRNRLEDAADY